MKSTVVRRAILLSPISSLLPLSPILGLLCLTAFLVGCSQSVIRNHDKSFGSPETTFYDSAENEEGILEAVDDLLVRHRREKLDINTVSGEELERWPEMDREEVDEFLSYRSRRGRITSTSELDSVSGLSPMARFLMRMILAVHDERDSGRSARSWMEIRFSADRSWSSEDAPKYAGTDPYRKTVRISARFGQVRAAFTTQNEPHEAIRWDPAQQWYGFDHMAAHVRWTSHSNGIEIIGGDFKVDVGQGLVHARPFGMRLSTEAPWRNLKTWSMISGYSGSTRQPTFRGAALRFSPIQGMSAWIFASNVRTDAKRIASSDADSQGKEDVFALVQSDLHVTETQRSHRQVLSNRTAGFILEYRFFLGRIGFQVSRTRLSRFIVLSDNFAPPTRDFSGSSAFWSLTSGAWTTTAELSFGPSKPATVFGFVWRPITSLRLVTVARFYPEHSFTLYGRPYGYHKRPGAQRGLLVGAGVVASPVFSFSTILDYSYESPSSKTLFFPVHTSDYRVTATLKATSGVLIALSLRQKNASTMKVRALDFGSGVHSIVPTRTTGASLRLHYAQDERWSVEARVDANTYTDGSQKASRGFHLSVRVSSEIFRGLWIVGQQSVYGVPSSDNRFYIHEPDIKGRLNVASLNNSGQHSSVLIRINPAPRFEFEFKFAGTVVRKLQRTTRPDRAFVPSTTTAGRVAIQCRLAL